MRINNFFKLVIAIAVSEMAGVIGAFFTTPAVQSNWYAELIKPALNPPAWIFGPVWTTLFALMGIAAFLVWKKGLDRRDVKIALGIFAGQLVLNTLWSIIFFGSTSLTINGLNNIGIALIEIIFLWLAILATIIAFAKISPPSPRLWRTGNPAVHPVRAFFVSNGTWLLLIPYLLWVSFAGYLNYAIWSLN